MHTAAGFAISNAIDRVGRGDAIGTDNRPADDEADDLAGQLARLAEGKSVGEAMGDTLAAGIMAGLEMAGAECELPRVWTA